MSGKRKKYTPEFREQAAGLVIETGRPVAHLVVCFVGVQDSGLRPVLDGAAVHAETLREFVGSEQAVGAEPLGVAGQVLLRRASSTMRAVNGLPWSER